MTSARLSGRQQSWRISSGFVSQAWSVQSAQSVRCASVFGAGQYWIIIQFTMRPVHVLGWSVVLLQLCLFLFVGEVSAVPAPQESKFEVPVQLIGFPVIIMAVRMSNFVKKLAYSLNPQTYKSRSRRSIPAGLESLADIDAAAVEKRLVKEMGEGVCVYETVCGEYAKRAHELHGGDHKLDWPELIRHYEESPEGRKEYYLLSVFLGDIVASPRLCHQLAKRGRSCK